MTTAGEPWLLDVEDVAGNYVERLALSPDALRGKFGSYRAIDENYAQNQQRKTRRLTLPVLAIGGGKSIGEGVANTMRRVVAENVQGHVIRESGHWLAEEAPEQVLAVATPFLALTGAPPCDELLNVDTCAGLTMPAPT
jgi:pimeloyl-ACP methyl ester carboxylesterase